MKAGRIIFTGAVFVSIVSFSVFIPGAMLAASEKTGRFGVHIGGQGKTLNLRPILNDLGVSWVRINNNLDGTGTAISPFLDAGFNVVITIANRDPANIDTTYGTLVNAGYPFKSKEVYQHRIREILTPLLPYLKQGRQIWVQCENEVGDASKNPKARFWRGTMEQYARQLEALYEAVKALDPSIPVVLSSFTSEQLSWVIRPDDPHSEGASRLFTAMLTKGRYDAVDLHFYGCVEDIPAEVQWVKAHMPSEKRWISTENGGPDARCPSTPISWEHNPAEYERIEAQQVSQRLSACADNGGSVCLWFSFLDMTDETRVFTHMGLIDGRPLKEEAKRLKGMKKGQGRNPHGALSEEQMEQIDKFLRRKPAYEAFKAFVATHR